MSLFSLQANSPSVKTSLNYNGLSKRPSLLQSLTRLKVSELNNIYTQTVDKYEDCEERRLTQPDRKRKVKAGYPQKLPLRERLLMLLIYYRLTITSTLTEVLFDLK